MPSGAISRMNALYCDMDGELFDPINGVEDCIERGRAVHRRRESADHRGQAARLSVLPLHGEPRARAVRRGWPGCRAQRRRAIWTTSRRSASARRCAGCSRCPRWRARSRRWSRPGVLDFAAGSARAARHLRAARAQARTRIGAACDPACSRWAAGASRSSGGCRMTRSRRPRRSSWRRKLLIDFHINEAAYRFPAFLSDAVEVAATFAGWTEAGKSAVVAASVRRSTCRNSRSRAMTCCSRHAPGPKIGAELDRLETAVD